MKPLWVLILLLQFVNTGECASPQKLPESLRVKMQYKDASGTLQTQFGRIGDYSTDSLTIIENEKEIRLASHAILWVILLTDKNLQTRFDTLEQIEMILQLLVNPKKFAQMITPPPTQTDRHTRHTSTSHKSNSKQPSAYISQRQPKSFASSPKKFSFKPW